MFRELFRRTRRTATTRRATQKPTTPDTNAKPSKPVTTSILGANTHFVGTLHTEGNVEVADRFDGDITAKGYVKLGSDATLDGDLICERATVAGLVKGNIIARSVKILGSGRVLGDLKMERLFTEEGAFIQGLITLEEKIDLDELTRKPAKRTAVSLSTKTTEKQSD